LAPVQVLARRQHAARAVQQHHRRDERGAGAPRAGGRGR
jgi:hypothetical protein